MATRSPTLAVFSSSCATNFEVRRCALPYISSRTCHSTATTQLFCILSLTTTPTFSDFSAIANPQGPPEGGHYVRLRRLRLLGDHRLDPRQVPACEPQL